MTEKKEYLVAFKVFRVNGAFCDERIVKAKVATGAIKSVANFITRMFPDCYKCEIEIIAKEN